MPISAISLDASSNTALGALRFMQNSRSENDIIFPHTTCSSRRSARYDAMAWLTKSPHFSRLSSAIVVDDYYHSGIKAIVDLYMMHTCRL